MPLSARLRDGTPVDPFTTPQLFQRVHTHREPAACPACGAPVIAKRYHDRISHFAHRAGNSACVYGGGGESLQHLMTKGALARDLAETNLPGGRPYVEVEAQGDGWRADILVHLPTQQRRIAFEVQLSNQASPDAQWRTRRYAGDHVETVWVVTRPVPGWSRGLPAIVIDSAPAPKQVVGGLLEVAACCTIAFNSTCACPPENLPPVTSEFKLTRALELLLNGATPFHRDIGAFVSGPAATVKRLLAARREERSNDKSRRSRPRDPVEMPRSDAALLLSPLSVARRRALVLAEACGGKAQALNHGAWLVVRGDRELVVVSHTESVTKELLAGRGVLMLGPGRLSNELRNHAHATFDAGDATAEAWLAGRAAPGVAG